MSASVASHSRAVCDTMEATVCLGVGDSACLPLSVAAQRLANASWLASLPPFALRDDHHRNCLLCNDSRVEAAMACSRDHPEELWDTSAAVSSLGELPTAPNTIDYVEHRSSSHHHVSPCNSSSASPACVTPSSSHRGWLPSLLPNNSLDVSVGWREYMPKSRGPVVLPCSSARGDDAAVLRTFFTDRVTGRALRGGTFLEIGAYDGITESNTWLFEGCLGWRGVLVEAQPHRFKELRQRRPSSLNLQMAACEAAATVNFSAYAWAGASIVRPTGGAGAGTSGGNATVARDPTQRSAGTVAVPCAPLGASLTALGVRSLDFLSVDTEGAELLVIDSLVASVRAGALSMGVLLVEVRPDGLRRGLAEALLGVGMRYVGQLTARGTSLNMVVDDVYVNLTHLSLRHPRSRALRHASTTPAAHAQHPAMCATGSRHHHGDHDGDTPSVCAAGRECAASWPPAPSEPMRWYDSCPTGRVRAAEGCVRAR